MRARASAAPGAAGLVIIHYLEGDGTPNKLDALRAMSVPVERIQLIGGGAQSEAVRAIAPAVLGFDVMVPEPGEYVADGAARQAAWVLSAANGGDRTVPPTWSTSPTQTYRAAAAPWVRDQYAAARELTVARHAS